MRLLHAFLSGSGHEIGAGQIRDHASKALISHYLGLWTVQVSTLNVITTQSMWFSRRFPLTLSRECRALGNCGVQVALMVTYIVGHGWKASMY